MRLNTIRKAAAQITQLENGAKVVTAASNSSVAAVGLVSNAGSRHEAVSGSASINRSITLGALGSQPGVNVKSVLHRERVGVYGVTVPSNAASVATALVDAANTREVTQANRDHALAALNGASGQEKIVCEDYLHMTGFQVRNTRMFTDIIHDTRELLWEILHSVQPLESSIHPLHKLLISVLTTTVLNQSSSLVLVMLTTMLSVPPPKASLL